MSTWKKRNQSAQQQQRVKDEDMTKIKEIWKPIAGYEGLYEISNKCRVRSLDRQIDRHQVLFGKRVNQKYINKGRVMRQNFSQPYPTVNLWKDRSVKTKSVHRMAAIAFIPNPYNLPIVNHLNGDKHDCRIDNLEWCTDFQNVMHAADSGLRKHKLKPSDIPDIRHRIKRREKFVDIAKLYNVSSTTIQDIKNNRRWKAII